MPAADTPTTPLTALPFPPITTAHILNCSFHSWHPKLRSVTPKARIIPLTTPFLDYLRSDGIILPPETTQADDDSGYCDSSDDEEDISLPWHSIHLQIQTTMSELGGKVVPKLNWSAPKDATWISPTNDMECRTPNDIYLLLKSSDFISHDLEHAFSGCIDASTSPSIPYHLILRKSFNINPSLEFRCFVRNKILIAICQRDLTHFEFLFPMRKHLKLKILSFLEQSLLPNFPDSNFVFDVYIPPPHEKVWLIDINPWAPRTDPLLFSWLELLQMADPELLHNEDDEDDDGVEGVVFDPEFRLVQKDDPEAYQFASTKYSAHKLPKDVVDASMTPERMKEMMEQWRKVMDKEDLSEDE